MFHVFWWESNSDSRQPRKSRCLEFVSMPSALRGAILFSCRITAIVSKKRSHGVTGPENCPRPQSKSASNPTHRSKEPSQQLPVNENTGLRSPKWVCPVWMVSLVGWVLACFKRTSKEQPPCLSFFFLRGGGSLKTHTNVTCTCSFRLRSW